MKTVLQFFLTALLLIWAISLSVAQTSAVAHNTWMTGSPMPTARTYASGGAIGENIYVVDGTSGSEVLNVNEIYNTKTRKWTNAASDPTPRWAAAYAVVNGLLYVIGGYDRNGNALNVVESYSPVTNSWSTLAPFPISDGSMTTAVDKNVIYVFGGDTTDIGSGQWLSNVESYDIEGNAWTDEASMLVARGWAAAGLFGTVIVAADGNPGPPKYMTGDNEAYNVKTNKWSELQADPTPRDAPCYSAIGGKLYIAGGENGNLLTLTEAYTPSTKSWSTLASMPKGVVTPVNAVVGGRLYCIGGGNALDNIPVDYVQVYQP